MLKVLFGWRPSRFLFAEGNAVRWLASGALLAVLAGCAVGPDYVRPELEVGTNYKQLEGWTQAAPADDQVRGDWWRAFGDSGLNTLMEQMLEGNLTIVQAEARYREAQALLRSTRSGFFPVVGSGASATRSGSGSGQAGGSASGPRSTQLSLEANVSWEPDLWGKVRRSVEAGEAQSAASAADLLNTRLSMQALLAQNYFRLNLLDAEIALYEKTLAAYKRSLEMTENRYAVGVAARVDVTLAQTQYQNAHTQLLALQWQRAQMEHAIAVLLGKPPSAVALVASSLAAQVPSIPVGLPSQLLERRPDVAAAERRTAAANAQIGVAQAAWFPDLVLSAQGGFRSDQLAHWLTAPFNFWSLGPRLALTLFDAGARGAKVDQARAAYDAQVAEYRLVVLSALQEVEDYLVQLRTLEEEQTSQGLALAAAREALELTLNQYEAGMIDYLSVVQTETSALNAERAALGVRADRLVASVLLVAALGGGWEVEP